MLIERHPWPEIAMCRFPWVWVGAFLLADGNDKIIPWTAPNDDDPPPIEPECA